MRSKEIAKAEKSFGTVTYCHKKYILLQNAYNTSAPRNKYPTYEALCVLKGESEDSDGQIHVYRATWNVLEEYVTFNDSTAEWLLKLGAPEDESVLCDWEQPTNVQKAGLMDSAGWIYMGNLD